MIKKITFYITFFLLFYWSNFNIIANANLTENITKQSLNNKINYTKISETDYIRKTLDMINSGQFKASSEKTEDDETDYNNNKQRFRLKKEFIFLMYIFCESSNSWTIKINGNLYDSTAKDTITINNIASIIKVDKNAIWFLLLDSSEEKISQLENIKSNKRTPYKNSYKIIDIDGKKKILFRLFSGQIINTRTMLIEEF